MREIWLGNFAAAVRILTPPSQQAGFPLPERSDQPPGRYDLLRVELEVAKPVAGAQ